MQADDTAQESLSTAEQAAVEVVEATVSWWDIAPETIGALVGGIATIFGVWWGIRAAQSRDHKKKELDDLKFQQATNDWFFNACASQFNASYITYIKLREIEYALQEEDIDEVRLLELVDTFQRGLTEFEISESSVSILKSETLHEYAALREDLKEFIFNITILRILTIKSLLEFAAEARRLVRANTELVDEDLIEHLLEVNATAKKMIADLFDVYRIFMVELNGNRFENGILRTISDEMDTLLKPVEKQSIEYDDEPQKSMSIDMKFLKTLFSKEAPNTGSSISDSAKKKLAAAQNRAYHNQRDFLKAQTGLAEARARAKTKAVELHS
ncbi:hypothetical protein [Hyphococcus lacteus]|uniref:Uncharacterized protein n=1 Tax=Hyphococcus lacteus TaxID=3143536 RepID=A0ABV3Z3Q7_9PROT